MGGYSYGESARVCLIWAAECSGWESGEKRRLVWKLFVQGRSKHGNYVVREIGSIFIELEPASHAVIGEIFCDAGFRDSEMVRKFWFQGVRAAAVRTAAKKIPDGDAKRLASFHVIVASEIRIAEHEHARTRRCMVRFIKAGGSAAQEPAELHFKL